MTLHLLEGKTIFSSNYDNFDFVNSEFPWHWTFLLVRKAPWHQQEVREKIGKMVNFLVKIFTVFFASVFVRWNSYGFLLNYTSDNITFFHGSYMTTREIKGRGGEGGRGSLPWWCQCSNELVESQVSFSSYVLHCFMLLSFEF